MKKLVELVNLWAQYAAENPDLEIRDFCVRYLTEAPQPATAAPREGIWLDPYDWDARLGKAVGKLSKYSYFYAKKAMSDLPLNNIDELVYLA